MKVLCILYDDPKGGMPSSYPVETLPKIENFEEVIRLECIFGESRRVDELFLSDELSKAVPFSIADICALPSFKVPTSLWDTTFALMTKTMKKIVIKFTLPNEIAKFFPKCLVLSLLTV